MMPNGQNSGVKEVLQRRLLLNNGLSKHVSVAEDMHTVVVGLSEVSFANPSLTKLYKQSKTQSQSATPRVGETVKYGHDICRTQKPTLTVLTRASSKSPILKPGSVFQAVDSSSQTPLVQEEATFQNT
jgi:hypothetical protein